MEHFAGLLDPETGRSRVRRVGVSSDFHANAFALRERIPPEDLEDPARLVSIAGAAKLSADEARERDAPRWAVRKQALAKVQRLTVLAAAGFMNDSS